MALGREHPVWRALATELLALVAETGATNAVVTDAAQSVWCRANELSAHDSNQLDWHHRSAAESAGSLDVTQADVEPYQCAVSFASIYVVLIWFDAPFAATSVRAAIEAHLPEIEHLTMALPLDDPDPAAGWEMLD